MGSVPSSQGVRFALLATPAERPPAYTPDQHRGCCALRHEVATARNATEPTTFEIDDEATSKVADLTTEPEAPAVAHRRSPSATAKVPGVATSFSSRPRRGRRRRPSVIIGGEAGRLPVPGALKSQVDDLVADQERLGDLPIYITNLQVLDGKLVVCGQK